MRWTHGCARETKRGLMQRSTLDAERSTSNAGKPSHDGAALLRISNLGVAFETNRGLVQPVRDVSFCIYPGQTVALVGESGCGKSVTSLAVLRLIPSPPGRIVSGSVMYDGQDLVTLPEK